MNNACAVKEGFEMVKKTFALKPEDEEKLISYACRLPKHPHRHPRNAWCDDCLDNLPR